MSSAATPFGLVRNDGGAADLDIEGCFPADPELMISPEGDRRGLRQVRALAAAERRSHR